MLAVHLPLCLQVQLKWAILGRNLLYRTFVMMQHTPVGKSCPCGSFKNLLRLDPLTLSDGEQGIGAYPL